MQRITTLFGIALIATGVGFYVGSGADKHWTALIPAIIGALFILCAWIATKGEKARMHAMHVVALLCLASAGATFKGVTGILGGSTSGPTMGRLITFVLCVLLLVLCINSFIQARKARNAGGN